VKEPFRKHGISYELRRVHEPDWDWYLHRAAIGKQCRRRGRRGTIFSGSPSSSSKPQVSLETLPKKILGGVVVGAGRAGHPI
jgi:hypothetical protein